MGGAVETRAVIRLTSITGAIAIAVAVASFAEELPGDVQSFVEKYQLCEHFRGEHTGGSSPERDKQVNERVAEVCPEADKVLVQLRKKYRSNPRILTFLEGFHCSGLGAHCE